MKPVHVRKQVLLFDFGDTLVGYRTQEGFQALLRAGIKAAGDAFRDLGLANVPPEVLWRRVEEENREPIDWSVRRVEERFGHIFGFEPGDVAPEVMDAASRAFLAPLLATSRLYDDTLPTLDALRERGHRLGLVSNMPWGTPTAPWREELARYGISDRMEHMVFCHDVGRRKPHPAIFAHALSRFACTPQEAVFIGDRPDWDIEGARTVGMDAILIDRERRWAAYGGWRIERLSELLHRMTVSSPERRSDGARRVECGESTP